MFVSHFRFIRFNLDFLQRVGRLFPRWCSSAGRNKNYDTQCRRTLPFEWFACERSANGIIARVHRMWSGAIFHNERYPIDFTRYGKPKNRPQCVLGIIEKLFWQIEIQFCWTFLRIFIRNEWIHFEMENLQICRRTGKLSTTISGMFDGNAVHVHDFTPAQLKLNILFFLLDSENARRWRCAILSNISNISRLPQWFIFQIERRFVYNDFQFIWISIDARSIGSRSQWFTGRISNSCRTLPGSLMRLHCRRNWSRFWWMEGAQLNNQTKIDEITFVLWICLYYICIYIMRKAFSFG